MNIYLYDHFTGICPIVTDQCAKEERKAAIWLKINNGWFQNYLLSIYLMLSLNLEQKLKSGLGCFCKSQCL